MSDESRQPSDAKGLSWGKVLLGTVAMLSLVAGVISVARVAPITKKYYTDADSIRVPAAEIHPRDILWQPANTLSELLNTTTNDYEPRLSADGVTLFFVRGKAGENADIFVAVKTPEGWGEPAPLAGINSTFDDLGPEPAPDGRSLYFYSDRPGGAGGYDLWVASREGDGWGEPINLGSGVNSDYNDYGPALTPDGGTLYFASNRPHTPDAREPDLDTWPATLREDSPQRDYDLYVSRITDGGAQEAAPLAALNTPYNDGAPAVSTFGDFLYFASDRPGGEGAFDLYRSRRLHGQHLAPANLGDAVNTPANELDPGLSLGGYALYFSSDRQTDAAAADGQRGYNLFYTTSREVFDESERIQRPPIDWAAIWRAVGPNLLWALLLALMLLALLALLRDARGRRLSLLARCLMASVAAHMLLLMLFNVWEVTATLAEEFGRRGPIQIALASPSAGSELFGQIRGELTNVETPAAPSVEPVRQATPTEMTPVSATASLDVAPQQLSMQESPQLEARTVEATVTKTFEPPTSIETMADTREPTPLAVETPSAPSKSAVSESDARDQISPAEARSIERPTVAGTLSMTAQATEAVTPVPPTHASIPSPSDATSMVSETAVREARPQPSSMAADTSRSVAGLVTPAARELPLPQAPEARQPDTQEAPISIAATQVSAPRRELAATVLAKTFGADVQRIEPAASTAPPIDQTLAPAADVGLAEFVPAHAPAATSDVVRESVKLPSPTDLALTSPETGSRTSNQEDVSAPVAPAPTVTLRRSLHGEPTNDTTEDRRVDLQPIQRDLPPSNTSLIAAASDLAESNPGTTPDVRTVAFNDALTMPASSELSLPALEQSTAGVRTETARSTDAETTHAPRAALGPALAMLDAAATPERFEPDRSSSRDGRPGTSLADTDVPLSEVTRPTPSYAGLLPGPDTAVTPLSLSLDLALPAETQPVDNPYAQRQTDDRLAIVERMGGSEATEKAVENALVWLAKHQSDDGRWDGAGFDESCGGCGGETSIVAHRGLTGLALLAFLGAGHTHTADGPYRGTVERGLRWLVEGQADDGDLRGDETMYSHGIATIAVSEAFGMTGDAALRDPVQRAVDFINAARNERVGGWRYDPGQAGDTSVLGWQIMALKSAVMNGVSVPAESFNAARKWLDKVATPSRQGLYAYQPGRRATPSMTAEGMFVQQLLGRGHGDERMQESAGYLMEHLPVWGDEASTYYWYYATLALFQHQEDHWPTWNHALTTQLLEHQRTDEPATGSWDPDGEWADKGGRVYQTALCAMMLEVYYRYLPLYSIEQPEDAIGTIEGRVTDVVSGRPLPGASVRLNLPDRDPVTADTDEAGHYRLFVPMVPDFFALSASLEGFDPLSKNVDAAMVKGTTLTLDFPLRPASEGVIAIESVPEVHHLGDNRFEGQINSQFQKEAEGSTFAAVFELSAAQVFPYISSAQLTLLAKGVQRNHKLRINGTTLDDELDYAPRDGSFGEFVADVDARLLREGANTFEVIAKPSSSDIDDFEFVNVQILLTP